MIMCVEACSLDIKLATINAEGFVSHVKPAVVRP